MQHLTYRDQPWRWIVTKATYRLDSYGVLYYRSL